MKTKHYSIFEYETTAASRRIADVSRRSDHSSIALRFASNHQVTDDVYTFDRFDLTRLYDMLGKVLEDWK